jgi:hypothetical protein
MARMYNRYGAADKNVVKFDTEITDNINGEPVGDDILVIRAFNKKYQCHISFMPNFADKTIGLAVDVEDEFSVAVLNYLIKSGEAERIMADIYTKLGFRQV